MGPAYGGFNYTDSFPFMFILAPALDSSDIIENPLGGNNNIQEI